MNRYQTILFDLDGTLADNYEGITHGVQQALAHLGIVVENRKELAVFIGPPLTDSFRDFYHLDEEQVTEAVAEYRRYYREKGVFEVTIYEGVPEMLKTLKAAGFKIATASSKPQVFVQNILESNHLAEYFDAIIGADLVGGLQSKEEVCNEALRITQTGAADAVLIGDRLHDAEGAIACNLDFIGVLYGFGGYEELSAYPSVLLAKTATEVTEFLLQQA